MSIKNLEYELLLIHKVSQAKFNNSSLQKKSFQFALECELKGCFFKSHLINNNYSASSVSAASSSAGASSADVSSAGASSVGASSVGASTGWFAKSIKS